MKEHSKNETSPVQRLAGGRTRPAPPFQLSAKDDKSGPGEWEETAESMSDAAKAYQSQISGRPWNQSYVVDGVKFDGYRDGCLLEAKSGMDNMVTEGRFKPWFTGDVGMKKQAINQSLVAGSHPVEWHFQKEETMKAAIHAVGFPSNIRPVYTP